jgi:EthD domain
MFKIMGFLTRKPGMTTEQFREHYITKHAPLVCATSLPQVGYRRNFLMFGDEMVHGHISAPGKIDFDVVTEMEFQDRAHFMAWRASRSPADKERVKRDELDFLDMTKLRVAVVDYVDVSY